MKILALDCHGEVGLGFALRCQTAGHEVLYARGGTNHTVDVGRGLINRVTDWEGKMRWADLIIVMDTGKWDARIEYFRKKGFPIFGPSLQAIELELNREFGQQVMEACGIQTIPSHKFMSYDDAMTFLTKSPKRYVSKPNGDAAKELSYVSSSPSDLMFKLREWKKHTPKQDGFLLQEFIPGIEFAVGGWFGPGGWAGEWSENFEHKKLCAGDIGPNTGEMGTCIRYTKESKLADLVLRPLESVLHAMKYVGTIDVAVIIDGKGEVWPLEFTPRFPWPGFNIMQELHEGDPANWMLDLLEGRNTLKVTHDVSCGVVLAIKDFPHSHMPQKAVEGVPIYGVNRHNSEHIHWAEVQAGSAPHLRGGKFVEEEVPVSAGNYLGVVTGAGRTVRAAQKAAYETLNEIEIPCSPIYRPDIGDRLEKQLPLLQRHGFATSWKW